MSYKGKVRVHDATEAASVAVGTANLAGSIFTRIVNYYATETERANETTSSPSGVGVKMTNADKLGMLCYVGERAGYFSWDGSSWKPVAGDILLAQASRPSPAETNTTTPGEILRTGDIVLPPGNRVLEIIASADVSALGTTGTGWAPRTWIEGSNIGVGYMGQPWLETANLFDVSSRTWIRVCSGTVQWKMFALNGFGNGTCRWTNSELTIIDRGPA